MKQQHHSGEGDNVGGDKNVSVSIKATLGIIVALILSFVFWKVNYSGPISIDHSGVVSNDSESSSLDTAQIKMDTPEVVIERPVIKVPELGLSIQSFSASTIEEAYLPTYSFTIKNNNHRKLQFGFVLVEVVDYQAPNYTAHLTPDYTEPIPTLIELKAEIGYKIERSLTKIGRFLNVGTNEVFSSHLKFHGGEYQGKYYLCMGAYALRVSFYDISQDFIVEHYRLIYLVDNEFVSEEKFKETVAWWGRSLNGE